MSQRVAPPASASDLTPLDAALVERFRRDLEALTGKAPDSESKLGISVSGGPDSVALLLLAAAAYPGSARAATVDHGLRPESRDEAVAVSSLCARLGVPHEILTVAVGPGNTQQEARDARYQALAFWAGSGTLRFDRPWQVEWVATGHQQDDVAETFLMRARRGAGVRGLAAMRRARPIFAGPPEVPALIRPLLDWSREELTQIVRAAGVKSTADPSNEDARFDRARIRKLLAQTDDLPAARLALAAQNLRAAEEALAWVVEREWHARHQVEDDEDLFLDAASLPDEIRRRLVDAALNYVRFKFDMDTRWDGKGLDQLVRTVDTGKAATLAGIKVTPCADGRWHFAPAPPRRSL